MFAGKGQSMRVSELTHQLTQWWQRTRQSSPDPCSATADEIQTVHLALLDAGLWPLTDLYFDHNLLQSSTDCLMLKIHGIHATSSNTVVLELISDLYTLAGRWACGKRYILEATYKVAGAQLYPRGRPRIVWGNSRAPR
jgi:hypothetical protein